MKKKLKPKGLSYLDSRCNNLCKTRHLGLNAKWYVDLLACLCSIKAAERN